MNNSPSCLGAAPKEQWWPQDAHDTAALNTAFERSAGHEGGDDYEALSDCHDSSSM